MPLSTTVSFLMCWAETRPRTVDTRPAPGHCLLYRTFRSHPKWTKRQPLQFLSCFQNTNKLKFIFYEKRNCKLYQQKLEISLIWMCLKKKRKWPPFHSLQSEFFEEEIDKIRHKIFCQFAEYKQYKTKVFLIIPTTYFFFNTIIFFLHSFFFS